MTAEFYNRPAEEVARDLLGAWVVSEVGGERCVGRIVETEAYTGPDDEASHGHVRFGRTPRNGAMFGPPGRAYVYRIYGIHWCLNVVTGADGFPAAVLLRAAEPLEGTETMQRRRPGRSVRDLLRGPGNLCRALAVEGTLDHHSVDRSPLRLEPGSPIPDHQLRRGPRIGISRNAEALLRFWLSDSPWVSARAS